MQQFTAAVLLSNISLNHKDCEKSLTQNERQL